MQQPQPQSSSSSSSSSSHNQHTNNNHAAHHHQEIKTAFVKSVLQQDDQVKFLVNVYKRHGPGGLMPSSSTTTTNSSSTTTGNNSKNTTTTSSSSNSTSSSLSSGKQASSSEKSVPASKSTTVFTKKESEPVLMALIAHKDVPTNVAIMFLDYSMDNKTFRIRDFQLIKKHDFGIKIVDEIHFDLYFKSQATVYNLQSESASTQWVVVSSLIKVCKLVNDQPGHPSFTTTSSTTSATTYVSDSISSQPLLDLPPPKTETKANNRISLLKSTAELSLSEFLVDMDALHDGTASDNEERQWHHYYTQRMQRDKEQKNKSEDNQDISIDMFKKANRQVLPSSSNGSSTPTDIAQKATINTSPNPLQHEASRKDNWIQRQLKAKEEEFTEITPLSVVVCTWNVNNKFPSPDTSLAKWLLLDEFEADIYSIGMQEIDMTAGALLKEETETGQEWQNLFIKTFAEETKQHRYKLITARQLVGIYHCVLVKESLANEVTEIRNCAEGVGIMGMMGNKGGVGIRFKIFDSTFCFITAHLAPHMGAVERRNQNFHDICKKADFGNPFLYRPDQHEFFFWFGDLNYRINQPNLIVREKIKKQDYKFLMKYDQLMIEKNAQNAFVGFCEGEITFDPTYKFDSGTDTYDTSEKGRVPSYTDRILWREDERGRIVQKSYKSFKEYKMSDHKPVTSWFEVGVKKIVEEKYKKCYLDIIKMLDKLENDMLPEVAITGQSINYENVKYDEPITQTVCLHNTGQVVCEYQFVPKPQESQPCKPYVTIQPLEGYVIPGETEEIKVTIQVNSQRAPKLLSGDDTIDDILILHLKNGRDHFISITGNYVKSCFGSTLDQLVKQKYPIQRKDDGLELSSFEKDLKVPKELWRLIDLLYQKGLKEEGLFKYSGTAKEVHYIRDCLDEGLPITNPVSCHSIAEALITFLESLREPVVPFKFYQMSLNASANPATCYHLISMLNDAHCNTFHYLMSFLRECLKHKKSNGLTQDEVAIIFSRVLIRPPHQDKPHTHHDESSKYFEEQRARAQFISHFLREGKLWSRDDVLRGDELEDEDDMFDHHEQEEDEDHNSSLLANDQLTISRPLPPSPSKPSPVSSSTSSSSQPSSTATTTTSTTLSADEFL
ncbi:hypothetical protein FDP41_006896 [Naegleria fowleri]|uniref:Rho-GAP domain-containing protein n=1 Tax=Naegleria fowleri TaxID=5763 RepID=A0A6A5BHT2_NAEFO|nr:uncharacterized protein FDP41_006896 [Naegleria fowleri]KAF0974286.1 hypothetical protein FDP41_006896 [Naegleria fowleri]CAG4715659.1 unnamed protein product [Naegleria fowleri]